MTSEPFEVSDDNESLQMLTRNSQIGEFYVMSPPQVPPQGDSPMYTCDIMIFDEERDAHVRISWNEALKATLCTAGSVNDEGELKTFPTSSRPTAARTSRRVLRGRRASRNGPRRPPRGPISTPGRGKATMRPPRSTARTCASSSRVPSSSTPCITSSWPCLAATPVPLAAQTPPPAPTPHSPRPHRLPPNHRRRHALRSRGHAALGKHPSQDHRGPL